VTRLIARLPAALLVAAILSTARVAYPLDCPGRDDLAVQVLGSGGPIADDARASAAHVVWIDGASRILIDAGGGAFLRFGEAGARFEDLDFIGLSHFHTDHSADLPALLKSGWFSDRSRPLAVAGPGPGGPFPGLQAFLSSLLDAQNGAYGYLPGYLDGSAGLVQLTALEVAAGAGGSVALSREISPRFTVDAQHVPHGIVPALAFRVRVGDRMIVFATDQNGEDPAFAEFARDADLLVMHMAVPQDAGEAARRLHATPDRIGQVAAAVEAKALVLSHFMARSLRNLDENLARVRAHFKGPILVARDLTCFLPGGNG
jgi:ribonuclease BN (tRNA processing enzyme)